MSAVNGAAPRPAARRLNIVILGLSITSSWGNGHATTYRSLMKALGRRGHDVLFLECDKPWYREHRDLLQAPAGAVRLYDNLDELHERWGRELRSADLVIVGSYVPDGIATARLVRSLATGIVAFYDIDTPVTLAALAAGTCEYLTPELIPGFDLYLSFTGGPVLRHIERHYLAKAARPLHCAVDPEHHRPAGDIPEPDWALGYLGTYSIDRQPTLDALLCEPARRWPEGRFAVAGPLYPPGIEWPGNVERIEHVGPDRHASFYGRQRFTLNVTRTDMIRTGYSPSVRLFEAAACGVPIISDWWAGLDEFFVPGREVVVVRDADQVLACLREMPEGERTELARRARDKVLSHDTAAHRAALLETYVDEARARRAKPGPRRTRPAGGRDIAAAPSRLVATAPK